MEVVSRRDAGRVREEGAELKDVEECSVKSSMYGCIWLSAEERKSSIRRSNIVGDRTEP